MKVTFFSNFLNHHQLPFCEEMYRLIGDNYRFVATEPIPQERIKLGYRDMSLEYPFAINSYTSKQNYDEALKLAVESDVAIFGSAPKVFVRKRTSQKKLTFLYKERVFKNNKIDSSLVKQIFSLLYNHKLRSTKNIYLLCASAYTSYDYSRIRSYICKSFKWGYFPEFIPHDLSLLKLKKSKNKLPRILWVGRFLKWKHPEYAIQIARKLKENNLPFNMDLIGVGEMEETIIALIDKYSLSNQVRLLGSMSPNQVRLNMVESDILLFTSDFNEGWGAVLNEAMNSGCAVIASHAIGAVPFLINHGLNGYIYENDNIDDCYNYVKMVLLDERKRVELGLNAYSTISDKWNADVASKRFIKLSESLLFDYNLNYSDGPCSKADIIKNNWIKE